MAIKQVRFGDNYKVALTIENGVPTIWGSPYAGCTQDGYEIRTFTSDKGEKAILMSDKGAEWEREKKQAEHCEYAEFWRGKFPYESWAFAVKKCKLSGKCTSRVIWTGINESWTDQDKFRQDCLTYVPESVNT